MLSPQNVMTTVEELPRISLVSKAFSATRTTVTSWQDNSCNGRERGVIKGHRFWDVSGRALEMSKTLKPAISTLLAKHSESDICKGFEPPPTILFDVFMVLKVGMSMASSYPALVIICQYREINRRVGKIIRDSKILATYFGFGVLGSTRDPRLPHGPGIPQFIVYGDEIGQNLVPGFDVYVQRTELCLRQGTAIYVCQKEPGTFRKATLGGFLELETESSNPIVVAMTVAHVFDTSDHYGVPSEVSDELEDLLSDSEGNCNTLTEEPDTSCASPFQRPSVAVSSVVTNSADLDLVHAGYLYQKSSTEQNTSLDWALIRTTEDFVISEKALPWSHRYSYSMESDPSGKDCGMYSAHGTFKRGNVLESSLYLRMPGQLHFGEVLVVEMINDTISFGDSGGWLIKKGKERKVLGVLIAGHPQFAIAYATPIGIIIADIGSTLSCKVTIISEETSYSRRINPQVSKELPMITPYISALSKGGQEVSPISDVKTTETKKRLPAYRAPRLPEIVWPPGNLDHLEENNATAISSSDSEFKFGSSKPSVPPTMDYSMYGYPLAKYQSIRREDLSRRPSFRDKNEQSRSIDTFLPSPPTISSEPTSRNTKDVSYPKDTWSHNENEGYTQLTNKSNTKAVDDMDKGLKVEGTDTDFFAQGLHDLIKEQRKTNKSPSGSIVTENFNMDLSERIAELHRRSQIHDLNFKTPLPETGPSKPALFEPESSIKINKSQEHMFPSNQPLYTNRSRQILPMSGQMTPPPEDMSS